MPARSPIEILRKDLEVKGRDWLGTLAGGFADNYVNTAELLPTNWHV